MEPSKATVCTKEDTAKAFMFLLLGYILVPSVLAGFAGMYAFQLQFYKGAAVGLAIGVIMLAVVDEKPNQPKECRCGRGR